MKTKHKTKREQLEDLQHYIDLVLSTEMNIFSDVQAIKELLEKEEEIKREVNKTEPMFDKLFKATQTIEKRGKKR